MGVSINNVGYELPAQHHTMSGGLPEFHDTTWSMTRTDSDGLIKSALI